MAKSDRYWDSSAFIAFFKEEEGRFENCEAVLRAAEQGQLRIITSTLTYSEVILTRRGKGPQILSREDEEMLRDFFQYEFIVPVDLNRRVSEDARELMWRHTHLKAYDANHLASARYAGVSLVESFDGDFLKLDGKIRNYEGQQIRIQQPYFPGQKSLALSEPQDD